MSADSAKSKVASSDLVSPEPDKRRDINQNPQTPQTGSITAKVYNQGGHVMQNYHHSSVNVSGQYQSSQPGKANEGHLSTSSQSLHASQSSLATSSYNNYTAAAIGQNITQNFYGQGPNVGGDPTENEKVMKMLRSVNKVMWNKVSANIEILKGNKDISLDSRIYPQFCETNFYNDMSMEEEEEKDSHFHDSRKFYLRRQYVKDNKFQFEPEYDEHSSCSFRSVMEEFCKRHDQQCQSGDDQQNHEKLAVFGLFAQAGAGKTTCMRHWAKHTFINNHCSPKDSFYTPSETNRFSLVLFYDLKSVRYKENTTLQDFLFHGVLPESDKDFAFKWVTEHPSEVIIFFDGLDQATWTINEEHEINIGGPYGQADTPTVMCNLLSRNLLPQSRIILSSREFKAATLPWFARPKKTFTSTGFSLEDTGVVFNSLVSRKFHENPWEEFSKTSSSLQHFLTIPMFLAFSVLVYEGFRGFLPDSVTVLLAKVLELLQRCKNIQERRRIWQIMSKLKSLAHHGLARGLVVFSKEDLSEYELTVEDVRDLLLMVPSNNTLNQCLLEGEFLLFFCHQSVQEFLSACYIVELSLQDFERFIEAYINKDEWTVVRQFVVGLTFERVGSQCFVKISDKEEKQQILRESLSFHLGKPGTDNYQLLELYAAIYESDDKDLIPSIKEIKFYHLMLTHNAAHVISSLLAKVGSLDKIAFLGCWLSDDLLNAMAGNLQSAEVHAKYLAILYDDTDQDYSEQIHSCEVELSMDAINNFTKNISCDLIEIEDNSLKRTSGMPDLNNISRFIISMMCDIEHLVSGYFFNIILSDSLQSHLVKIKGESSYRATFDKETKELCINTSDANCLAIRCLVLATYRLGPSSVKFYPERICTPQYVDLKNIPNIRCHLSHAVEIEEVVLRISFNGEIQGYHDSICKFVRDFSVRKLHMVGREPECFDKSMHFVNDDLNCEINFVVMLNPNNGADLQELLLSLNQSQVKQLRLAIKSKVLVDVDHLSTFIRNLTVIEQLWIHYLKHDAINNPIFTDIDEQSLQEAARSSKIVLKFHYKKDFRWSNNVWDLVMPRTYMDWSESRVPGDRTHSQNLGIVTSN